MSCAAPWLERYWPRLQAGVLKTHQPVLITGALGRGQWLLAEQIAQACVCKCPDRPCGQCESCLQVQRRTHPDLYCAADLGQAFSVDLARELAEHTSETAHAASAIRMVMVEHFERATTAAQQALLKTIEEPFVKTQIILTAAQPNLILPTILSRCARLEIQPVSQKMFADWCIKHEKNTDPMWYDFTQGSPLRMESIDADVWVSIRDQLRSFLKAKGELDFIKLLDKKNIDETYAWIFYILSEHAIESKSKKDFDLIAQWQALYRSVQISSAIQWPLQCRAFFENYMRSS